MPGANAARLSVSAGDADREGRERAENEDCEENFNAGHGDLHR